jgi:hypothetical protein
MVAGGRCLLFQQNQPAAIDAAIQMNFGSESLPRTLQYQPAQRLAPLIAVPLAETPTMGAEESFYVVQTQEVVAATTASKAQDNAAKGASAAADTTVVEDPHQLYDNIRQKLLALQLNLEGLVHVDTLRHDVHNQLTAIIKCIALDRTEDLASLRRIVNDAKNWQHAVPVEVLQQMQETVRDWGSIHRRWRSLCPHFCARSVSAAGRGAAAQPRHLQLPQND